MSSTKPNREIKSQPNFIGLSLAFLAFAIFIFGLVNIVVESYYWIKQTKNIVYDAGEIKAEPSSWTTYYQLNLDKTRYIDDDGLVQSTSTSREEWKIKTSITCLGFQNGKASLIDENTIQCDYIDIN
ncbi:MAG: hypothetical protein WC477_07495 [Patescibacteria group bacterium]